MAISKWQVVGQDSDEIPRIDVDRVRRDSQWSVYVGSRRIAVILGAVLLFAGTVSTSTTAGFFQQRHDLTTVVKSKTALNKRVAGLSQVSVSLAFDQTEAGDALVECCLALDNGGQIVP